MPPKKKSDSPILISMGMEKVGKLYSPFILKTQDNKVIDKLSLQPDLKISAQMVLHDHIVKNFVNNEDF